jgi:hypothetical protein
MCAFNLSLFLSPFLSHTPSPSCPTLSLPVHTHRDTLSITASTMATSYACIVSE